MVFLRWCRFGDEGSETQFLIWGRVSTLLQCGFFSWGKTINKVIQFLIESEKWKKKSHFVSAITFYGTLNLRTKNKPWNNNTLQKENCDTWHPKSHLSRKFRPFYRLSSLPKSMTQLNSQIFCVLLFLQWHFLMGDCSTAPFLACSSSHQCSSPHTVSCSRFKVMKMQWWITPLPTGHFNWAQ